MIEIATFLTSATVTSLLIVFYFKLKEQLQTIMATQEELTALVTDLQATAADLKSDVSTLKTAVEAFIAEADNNIDVSGLQDAIDSLKSADADVEATTAEVTA